MSLADAMDRDALAIAEADGTPVTYTRAGGEVMQVHAFPSGGALDNRGTTQGRALHKSLLLDVPKLELDAPDRNGDKVDVPGRWMNEPDPVTLRVGSFESHPSSPGFWQLRCS